LEAGEEELALMTKIVGKMKGEVAQVEEKKPKKPVAKSMTEALNETAESLK
jgi:hypothetical protein